MLLRRKLVVVGDGGCGKTSLLIRFDDFVDGLYIPTVFDTFATEIEVNGKLIELELYDTAGQEDYVRLRPLAYPDSHVFLLCYSIADADSLKNVAEKWVPELRHYCPAVPVVLVGLKADVRNPVSDERKTSTTEKEERACSSRMGRYVSLSEDDTMSGSAQPVEDPLSSSAGQEMARSIGAYSFFECSALSGMNIREVFESAAKAALESTKKRKRARILQRCDLL